MASTRSNKRREVVPIRILAQDKKRGAAGLSGLTLDGRPINMLLGERLLDASLERTIEGSSTITLGVWDGDRAILGSAVLGTRLMAHNVRIKLDGLALDDSDRGSNSP